MFRSLPPDALPEPFFVVGAQRSGTTMLRLMLNNHPRLVVPHESAFITEFFARAASYGDLRERRNAERLLHDIGEHPHVRKAGLVANCQAILDRPIAQYADLVRAIFDVYAAQRGKARWGDKTPSYVTELDVLWRLFPGCRIIHLVRDGRDVALSSRTVSWGTGNTVRAAQEWRWKTLVARKLGGVLGDCYLEVRYEDLVSDTEGALRCVCAHIDEPYDGAMLAYHEDARREVPADSLRWHETSVRAPDRTKVYAWKRHMSIADRIIFEQHARDALATFGYECEGRRSTLGSRLKNVYYATLKRW